MKNITIVACMFLLSACAEKSAVAEKQEESVSNEKEIYLPSEVWMVPENNDYSDENSEFSYSRMAESENVAVFWAKGFESQQSFSVKEILEESERFYDFYVNELHFLEKGNSVTDTYKNLIYIIDGEGGTAYGGGEDKKVGILWTPPSRIEQAPYGALAHELGHSFQYLAHADGAWAFTTSPEGSKGQPIFEMTSQYMLWQVYPKWIVFENYHLESYLKKTHYAFLHETNQYHSPFVLEYWSGKHGKDFIGKLWREAREGEDAVKTYKRLTGVDQVEFNDQMFDAARRFITWDLERIEEVSAPYANLHATDLVAIGDGWHQISQEQAPQNYGYNGIELRVPAAGTEVVLNFQGLTDADGFRKINMSRAGWRYGFIAVKEDGTRVYGKTHSNPGKRVTFEVPAQTEYLWLVVSGAPTEHWEHLSDGEESNDEQWPYKFQLKGTTLVEKSAG